MKENDGNMFKGGVVLFLFIYLFILITVASGAAGIRVR